MQKVSRPCREAVATFKLGGESFKMQSGRSKEKVKGQSRSGSRETDKIKTAITRWERATEKNGKEVVLVAQREKQNSHKAKGTEQNAGKNPNPEKGRTM